MSDLQAVIWADQSIETRFVDMAKHVLNKADSQLNISISVTDAFSQYGRVTVDNNSTVWREDLYDAKDDLVDAAPDHMTITNDQQHFFLVDQVHARSGQGRTWGTVGGPLGPWNSPSGCISCVNKAAKIWAESSLCYGGMGDMTFRATVMHNLGHGLIPAGMDHHETGEILNPGIWKNVVSPMQMGYTAAGCSGNEAVDYNCTGNPKASVSAINNEYSYCARSKIHSENKL